MPPDNGYTSACNGGKTSHFTQYDTVRSYVGTIPHTAVENRPRTNFVRTLKKGCAVDSATERERQFAAPLMFQIDIFREML